MFVSYLGHRPRLRTSVCQQADFPARNHPFIHQSETSKKLLLKSSSEEELVHGAWGRRVRGRAGTWGMGREELEEEL